MEPPAQLGPDAVVRSEGYSSYTRGRQWRTFLRFAHTGEFYGIVGQTIAGLVTLGSTVLVYTGLALSLRRLLRWWRAPKAMPAPVAAPVAAPALRVEVE